jgi:hypothetical protein
MAPLPAAHAIIPESQWRVCSLLDDFGIPVKDQGATNSCVGHALTEGLEILWKAQGNPDTRFNAFWPYSLVSADDEGASISDAFEECRRIGVLPDDGSFPHRWIKPAKVPRQYPQAMTAAKAYQLEYGYHTGGWPEIGTAAQLGFPAEIGVPVYDSWMNAGPNNPVCLPSGSLVGWHAILVTGCRKAQDGQWLLEFLNSWGKSWGRNGVGYLTRSGLREPVDAFCMQSMRYSDEADVPPTVAA